VDDNVEQVLIVYSVTGTPAADIEAAERATEAFRLDRPIGPVRVEADTFRIPEAAAPATALSAELKERMDGCIGAIVFVDDLKPNVAYELGYFHGRGRHVLLVTRRDVDETWREMSDLAGAALAHLERVDLSDAVPEYLTRLYLRDLPSVSPVPLLALPTTNDNLLARDELSAEFPLTNGPYGPSLHVTEYEPPIDVPVHRNVLPGARVRVLLRAPEGVADFSIYADVRFQNRERRRRHIWLGVTSLRRDMWITRFERQFPARSATGDWQLLSLELTDLLSRGFLLGASGPDFLRRLRFRAGARGRRPIEPFEVGYVGISGIDA
jgi:hypothetical protein